MKCKDCNYESEEESDWFEYNLCTDCADTRGYIKNGFITEKGRKHKL